MWKEEVPQTIVCSQAIQGYDRYVDMILIFVVKEQSPRVCVFGPVMMTRRALPLSENHCLTIRIHMILPVEN